METGFYSSLFLYNKLFVRKLNKLHFNADKKNDEFCRLLGTITELGGVVC